MALYLLIGRIAHGFIASAPHDSKFFYFRRERPSFLTGAKSALNDAGSERWLLHLLEVAPLVAEHLCEVALVDF